MRAAVIGNDVIDLHFFDSPCYHHVNYLERTCTQEEAHVIRQSPDPGKSLAVVWASKEAVYKLLSKRLTMNGFVPRQFVTQIDKGTPPEAGGRLAVNYAGTRYSVALSATKEWVHAVAAFPESQNVHWAVCAAKKSPFLGPRAESEAVRSLAADLLLKCGFKNAVVEFVGKVPVLSSKTGGPAGADISLAHHGAYASAAIGWPLGDLQVNAKILDGFAQVSFPEETCFTCIA